MIVSKPAAADSSHRERIKTNVKSAAANLAESLITGTIASIPGEVRPNTNLAESRSIYLEKSDLILIGQES